jgi:hypothetical protein
MALIDPCLSFSSVIWFLVTFVSFFNFIISNKNFLGVLKNLKFRQKKLVKTLILIKELNNFKNLLIFIHLIFLKWLQKWNKLTFQLLKKI